MTKLILLRQHHHTFIVIQLMVENPIQVSGSAQSAELICSLKSSLAPVHYYVTPTNLGVACVPALQN